MTSISELTFFGKPIHHFSELVSTSDYLKEHDISEPILVVADHQTNGRGQYGRKWETDSNNNLTFSFQYYLDQLPAEEGYRISQLIALIIIECINDFIKPEKAFIKWPNDIILKNKKICGILIEPSIQNNHIQKIVVGIGINVHQTILPKNLPNAGSLAILYPDKTWHTNEILDKIITTIETQLPNIANIDTRIPYNDNLFKINEIVTIKKDNETLQCLNLGVNKEGFWVLKNLTTNEIQTIASSQGVEYVY